MDLEPCVVLVAVTKRFSAVLGPFHNPSNVSVYRPYTYAHAGLYASDFAKILNRNHTLY
jgi:hypothetical protein